MKKILPLLCLITAIGSWQLALAEEKHNDHDHDQHEEKADPHEGHDHSEDGHKHDHDEHADEAAAPKGRILKKVTPHLEFLATEKGKAEIRALDEHHNVIELPALTIKLFGGSRAKPTKLKFELKDNVLVSDGLLPEIPNAPIVLQIKDKDGNLVIERFNLNLNSCPSCNNKEYACTCDHDDHEGHDHDEGDHDDHDGHDHD